MKAASVIIPPAALLLYTTAVFWEKATGSLRGRHLLFFHALWATLVHARKNPAPKAKFHRYSLVVWAVWLLPYVSGMLVGMGILRVAA
jgi:hypothetical protein